MCLLSAVCLVKAPCFAPARPSCSEQLLHSLPSSAKGASTDAARPAPLTEEQGPAPCLDALLRAPPGGHPPLVQGSSTQDERCRASCCTPGGAGMCSHPHSPTSTGAYTPTCLRPRSSGCPHPPRPVSSSVQGAAGPPSPAGTRRGFRGQPGNSWRGVPAGQTGQDGQEQSSSSLKTPRVCVLAPWENSLGFEVCLFPSLSVFTCKLLARGRRVGK